MKTFYRSSEGIVTLIAAYTLVAFAVQHLMQVLTEAYGAITNVPFAVPLVLVLLLFGGVGIFLYAEALGRCITALDEATAAWTSEVANS